MNPERLWALDPSITFGPTDPGRVLPVTRVVRRTTVGQVSEEVEISLDERGIHGTDLVDLISGLALAHYPQRITRGIS